MGDNLAYLTREAIDRAMGRSSAALNMQLYVDSAYVRAQTKKKTVRQSSTMAQPAHVMRKAPKFVRLCRARNERGVQKSEHARCAILTRTARALYSRDGLPEPAAELAAMNAYLRRPSTAVGRFYPLLRQPAYITARHRNHCMGQAISQVSAYLATTYCHKISAGTTRDTPAPPTQANAYVGLARPVAHTPTLRQSAAPDRPTHKFGVGADTFLPRREPSLDDKSITRVPDYATGAEPEASPLTDIDIEQALAELKLLIEMTDWDAVPSVVVSENSLNTDGGAHKIRSQRSETPAWWRLFQSR